MAMILFDESENRHNDCILHLEEMRKARRKRALEMHPDILKDRQQMPYAAELCL